MVKANFSGYYAVTVEYKSGKRHHHPEVIIETIPGGFILTPKGGEPFTIKPHAWKHFEYRPCLQKTDHSLTVKEQEGHHT